MDKLEKAVKLSEEKYCGVSAVYRKAMEMKTEHQETVYQFLIETTLNTKYWFETWLLEFPVRFLMLLEPM